MNGTPEDNRNLAALLRNKGAIQHMDAQDISKILDSIKKGYEERFCEDLDLIPDELLGSVIVKLPKSTRHSALANLSVEKIHSILEYLDDEHISLIMRDIEGVDEGKFKKLFEKFKNADTDSANLSCRHDQEIFNNKNGENAFVRLYYRAGETVKIVERDSMLELVDTHDLFWVDMLKPAFGQIEDIESALSIDIPTINEREEIEVSSRYWEEEGITTINSYFITQDEGEVVSETVSLILKENYLVSVRFRKLKSFDELIKRVVLMPNIFTDGRTLLTMLLDIRIDFDADMIEKSVKEISDFKKNILSVKEMNDDILKLVSHHEDINMMMRDSMLDKSRIINALLRNKSFSKANFEDLKIMAKDLSSLIESVEFNFERLDSIQNITLASIGIKQGKAMTAFTIANVLFLPPTLIASIYGMNFEWMPELKWMTGYPMSIVLMILSSATPYLYFKKKKWL